MKSINLALIYGGVSDEREVSLKSGTAVKKALKERFNLLVYDPKKDLEKLIKDRTKIDLAFPILHGKYGEDGTIQGLLELYEIPYVGSGILGSAVGINKQIFKSILKSANLNYPQTLICKDKFKMPKFSGPWFVKPENQGSSVGISRAENQLELKSSFKKARKYDQVVHIEKEIIGTELTCGIIEENQKAKALPIVEIIPKKEFFNYQAKYDGTTEEIVPAKIEKGLENKVKKLAVKVFNLTQAQDFARIDFIVDRNQKPFILEINTIPGMTDESLLPKEDQAAGYSFEEFLVSIIQNAYNRSK
jgi:D-alanine-D-alanine ligase